MVWTRTDARKHDIGAIDVMYVVCFINIIKQKHIICRRKFLRFSIFKSKFLKGCSLKIPYNVRVDLPDKQRKMKHCMTLNSKSMYLLYHQTLKYFFIMSIYTLNHVKFLSL